MNEASHQGSLRALREAPFALLREMERRTRSGSPGGDSGAGAQAEWVGIGFQLANERFLVARDEIREVMMMPSGITRVPGAKDWVAGLANLRGQLLMVVDLRTFPRRRQQQRHSHGPGAGCRPRGFQCRGHRRRGVRVPALQQERI